MSCISRIQLTLLTLEIKAAVSSKQSDGAFMTIGQPTNYYCATLCFTLPFFTHAIPDIYDMNRHSCLHFMNVGLFWNTVFCLTLIMCHAMDELCLFNILSDLTSQNLSRIGHPCKGNHAVIASWSLPPNKNGRQSNQ